MDLHVSVILFIFIKHVLNVCSQEICFQQFNGRLMTCHGTLPNFVEDFLPQIHQVEDLDLLQCNFSHVPKDAFRGLNTLRSLLIDCGHKIANLTFDEGALHHLSNVHLLSLNYNDIHSLPMTLLRSISDLQFLYLTGNSLKSLADLGFGFSCDSGNVSSDEQRISILVLRENFIQHLPKNALCSLKNLMRLDLSGNGLMSIDESAFSYLKFLQDLDLSANSFNRIPIKALKDLPNLYVINLSDNLRLANVSHVLRHLPGYLKVLNLTNVGLETLESDYFHNMPHLNSLILNRNLLQSINESVLQPLIGLNYSTSPFLMCPETAYFSGKLEDSSMPSGRFLEFNEYEINMTGLRFISLDSNNFTAIPPVGVLSNLEAVSLDQNLIHTLNDDDFAQLSNLRALHLSFNHIKTISCVVFSNVTCLRELHLDHNMIHFIDPVAFDNNVQLTSLFLQFNRIVSVRGMFQENIHLQKLNLSHNLLEEVSLDAFPLNLVELDISANFLKVISLSEFSYPLHLQMDLLDLSNNEISYIAKEFFPISLKRLSLNDNHIANMSDCTLCKMRKLQLFTLHNNHLTTMQRKWLRTSNHSEIRIDETSVTLHGNPFICNCQLQTFIETRNEERSVTVQDFEMLQCHREYAIGREQMLSISLAKPPEDFLCRTNHSMNTSLSEKCTFYHDLEWQFVIADCSTQNLTSIPLSIPRAIVKLHFDGNHLSHLANSTFELLTPATLQSLYLNSCHIEEIDSHTFSPLTYLNVLHLENNHLHHLGPQVFDGLHELLELFLFSNPLKYIDETSFLPLLSIQRLMLNDNNLTSFPVWKSLKHFESVAEISLSNNPWSCDCGFVDQFREWLQKFSSKVLDINDLFCKYSDNSTSGIPLIAFNEANCYSSQHVDSFVESRYFPLTISISSVIIFLIIIITLMFVYRREMQVIIYSRYGIRLFSKNLDEDDSDKVFDAFISYSHDDEEFVMSELVPKLEGIEHPFRLCLHHRDFQVGVFITVNIFDAIAKSRRSILILSENFMRSEWCRFEFKTAHLQMFRDNGHRVILIILGDTPENLDPEMRNYMKTNTYLQWGDKLFFDRLYFAMPDRKAAKDSEHQ